jgi:hypothetical protein
MKIKITKFPIPLEYSDIASLNDQFVVTTEKLDAIIDLDHHLMIYAKESVHPRIKFYSDAWEIDIETKPKEKNTINYGKR